MTLIVAQQQRRGEAESPRNPSFYEATAGTNSAAQPDQPARVIKRMSFRRQTLSHKLGRLMGFITEIRFE